MTVQYLSQGRLDLSSLPRKIIVLSAVREWGDRTPTPDGVSGTVVLEEAHPSPHCEDPIRGALRGAAVSMLHAETPLQLVCLIQPNSLRLLQTCVV